MGRGKQTVRLEELIAAYNELALRDDKLVEGNLRGLPESYEQYDIKIPSPYLERDDEVLKRLYEKSLPTSRLSWFTTSPTNALFLIWKK